jgi:hypothetical protein
MKTTAKTLLAVIFGLACISRSFAATDVKDGFMEKNYHVLITRNGETKLMADEMRLQNGIEVKTDGTVIVPGGDRIMLKEGDTMSFGGIVTRADSGKVEQICPAK